MASKFVEDFQKHGGCIEAVSSRSMDSAKAFATEYGIPKAYDSYESMLEDEAVQIVYIASPNHLHYYQSLIAAKYSKAVLCEKPACLNAIELKEVLDVFKEKNLAWMEGFLYRAHPVYEIIRSKLKAGKIGQVQSMHAQFEIKMPYDNDEYRMHREYGGGAMMDLGVYPLSLIRWLLDEEPEDMVVESRKTQSIDSYAHVKLSLPSGINAQFTVSFEQVKPMKAVIKGSSGQLEINSPWLPDMDGARFKFINADGTEEIIFKGDSSIWWAREAIYFEKIYLEGKTEAPCMTWLDSLNQARAMDQFFTKFDQEHEV